jgi:excisionase family DNA binding protein
MTRAAALARLIEGKHPTLSADEFVSAVLDRLASDDRRAIPFYRVRELCPPLTKRYVHALIDSGELRACKLGGLLLIEADSVRAWLATAIPYAARRKAAR